MASDSNSIVLLGVRSTIILYRLEQKIGIIISSKYLSLTKILVMISVINSEDKNKMQLNTLVNNKFKTMALGMLAVVFAFALQMALAPKAHATTYNLKPDSTFNPAADCNIYDAIEAINTNAIVNFCPAGEAGSNSFVLEAGTYTLSNAGGPFVGNLPTITSPANLSVVGAGPSATIVNGNNFTGLNIAGGANYSISNLTLTGFQNDVSNGPLFQYGGNLTIDNIIARNNNCTYFDEFFNTNGTCSLFANVGAADSTLTVSNSAFYQNTAIYLFGAASVSGEGYSGKHMNVNMYNNTFSNNAASILLLLNNSSSETNVEGNFYNNTIADNTTNFVPSMLVLDYTNGALPSYGSKLNMRNNILFNNKFTDNEVVFDLPANCPESAYVVTPSTITSYGGNISGDTTCDTYFNQPTDKNSTDALLDPYTIVNGTGVRPLQANSPAIGLAVDGIPATPGTDQRGVARPQGSASDSGAYELEVSTPGLPNTGSSLASTGYDMELPAAIAGLLVLFGIGAAGHSLKRR